MDKQNNRELSRMFQYAGKYHGLTILGCVLSGISTILSMLPYVCIWLVIRDFIHAIGQGDITLAVSSGRYAWLAVLFSALSILLYFFSTELFPPCSFSYRYEYEKRGHASYRNFATWLFQSKRQRTLTENY